jgi:hypothetical protein
MGAYDPNELLTLADQLRLLMERGVAEDEAKARLRRLFELRGQEIYSPKFILPYQDATINWETGRAALRRFPRQWFTPTLTAALHYALFPLMHGRLTAGAETETQKWLIAMMQEGDPTQSKARYRQEAEQKFKVGKRAFDRAWASAIEASGNTRWSAAGRKSTR